MRLQGQGPPAPTASVGAFRRHGLRMTLTIKISSELKKRVTGRIAKKELQVGVEIHVVFFEAFADAGESFVDGISELEHLVFVFVDHAPTDHGAEIENLVPIFAAVNDDEVVARELAGLEQGHHFPEFIHGSEAAGKNDEGF